MNPDEKEYLGYNVIDGTMEIEKFPLSEPDKAQKKDSMKVMKQIKNDFHLRITIKQPFLFEDCWAVVTIQVNYLIKTKSGSIAFNVTDSNAIEAVEECIYEMYLQGEPTTNTRFTQLKGCFYSIEKREANARAKALLLSDSR